MADYQVPLTVLRSRRTRAATTVQHLIRGALTSPAPYTSPDGLPSWWPFQTDCIYDAVRECVRAARLVRQAEGGDEL